MSAASSDVRSIFETQRHRVHRGVDEKVRGLFFKESWNAGYL